MRLGQLARKLALRQSEVVAFLAAHQIHIEEGSNTKVEDNHVALVMQHFAPSDTTDVNEFDTLTNYFDSISTSAKSVAETVTEETHGADTGFSAVTHQIQETKPVEEREAEVLEAEGQFREEEEAEEIIRAPKVELPGLKVIGKIEIPELKKKEAKQQEEMPPLESQSVVPERRVKMKRPARENNRQSERPDRRPKTNPIALQREREAFDAEQKRREEIERQKELRTQRYLKKVKIAPPIRSAKLTDEPLEDLSSVSADKPKTLWGKFVKWLKT